MKKEARFLDTGDTILVRNSDLRVKADVVADSYLHEVKVQGFSHSSGLMSIKTSRGWTWEVSRRKHFVVVADSVKTLHEAPIAPMRQAETFGHLSID